MGAGLVLVSGAGLGLNTNWARTWPTCVEPESLAHDDKGHGCTNRIVDPPDRGAARVLKDTLSWLANDR